MISCIKCSTSNTLDSTFCRKCGAVISEIDIQEARTELEKLVEDGNHAFNENRTDDALAIADSVLVSDPVNTSALWLKAICHERRGEIPLALECSDRIVELNPDSELDKIRRTQLRNKLNNTLIIHDEPDRKMAMMGAAAAVILVICIGLLTANLIQGRNQPPAVVADHVVTDPSTSVENPPMTQQAPGTDATSVIQSNQNPGNQFVPGPGDEGAITRSNPNGDPVSNPPAPQFRAPTLPSGNANGPLPIASGSKSGIGEVGPVTPVYTGSVPVNPTSNGASKGTDDPDGTNFAVNNDPTPPADDPGQIVINVHNNPSPGAQPSGASANGAEALNRTALQAFQLGNYSQAANLFEQALRQGGDPVRINQRLGQALERLGRTGEAIDAYRRGVQAGEAAIAQGKPNPAGIRASMDSSQQALKKLGG